MNRKPRILLVDDEKRFVHNIARLLERQDFDVSTAYDGLQAVETVRGAEHFDVAVLDLNMPGLDGLGALQQIKDISPDTEVIILTGNATLENGIEALRLGAFDYLLKPCDIDDLVGKISEAYELDTIKQSPVLWTGNQVSQVAKSSFRHLQADQPLAAALGLYGRDAEDMAQERLYITDAERRLLGFVTKQDLLAEAGKAHPEQAMSWTDLLDNPSWLPPQPLASIMRIEIMASRPDEPLTEAANSMIEGNVRSMPVVEDGRVVGIVRLKDIFDFIQLEIE